MDKANAVLALAFNRKLCRSGSIKFGGAERRLTSIFSLLGEDKSINITITFIGVDPDQPIAKELYRYIVCDQCAVKFFPRIASFIWWALRAKIDVLIYADAALRSLLFGIVGKVTSCKNILLSVTHERSRLIYGSLAEKTIMDLSYRLSDVIDTLYPDSREVLQNRYMTKTISVTPAVLAKSNTAINIIKKRKLLLFASRLISAKNPELLLQAISLVKDDMARLGYVCFVCGDGPLKEKLIDLANAYELHEVVSITGYMNMDEITPQAKVFFSLQRNENYPSQSLLEAISIGCYCIATNVGNTKEIVKSDFGILVEQNAATLANAIKEAINFSPDRWNDIETSAQNFAACHFDIRNAVEHYAYLVKGTK